MKTDRELIELAARAAGLTVMWSEPFKRYERFVLAKYAGPWDPLTNNGDAFRLMIKLQIKVKWHAELNQALAWDGINEATVNGEDFVSAEASTRRAIVMAAADIGEQL